MRVTRHNLWGENSAAQYVQYLQDNPLDVDASRLRPAVIICPDGGFLRTVEREKEPIALYFLSQGYQAFVLDYSTKMSGGGGYPAPVLDLAKLVCTLRRTSRDLQIDPDKIAVLGFAAGGQVCASLATQWRDAALFAPLHADSRTIRPDAVVLCYPLLDFLYQRDRAAAEGKDSEYSPNVGMKKGYYMRAATEAGIGISPTQEQMRRASPYYHVNADVPPTFIWHTASDEMVYAGQSIRYAERLQAYGVPLELHLFERGPHGLALADSRTTSNPELIDPDAAAWPELCIRFLHRHLD